MKFQKTNNQTHEVATTVYPQNFNTAMALNKKKQEGYLGPASHT